MADALPNFRYHPDPLTSGSVIPSDATCACCEEARGYLYAGPVYAEEDLAHQLCPWCLADGAAAEEYDATFVDSEAFDDTVPEDVVTEIVERTPGYHAWQGERWPSCCNDATAFVGAYGIAELRAHDRSLEGAVMSYIVHDCGISGGAALRLLESFTRDEHGPTLYLFRCLHCEMPRFHHDRT